MINGKVLGRDAERFVQIFELFALRFWDETFRVQNQRGADMPRAEGGRSYTQVYKDQAYHAPRTIPHECSAWLETFYVARPGDADDEVEKP